MRTSKVNQLIDRIAEKKKRLSETTDRYNLFTQRYKDLVSLFYHYLQLDDQNTAAGSEILRYFLIASVANIEVYSRHALGCLVDSGELFCINAAREFKDIKFRLDSVFAMERKKVTIGDIFAHLVPLNDLDSILSAFSSIIGKDISAEVEKSGRQHDIDVFKTVAEVFRLRHICCHEVQAVVSLTPQWVATAITKCHTFGFAIECSVLEALTNNSQIKIANIEKQVKIQDK